MTLQKWSPRQKLVNGRQFAVRTERRLSARKSVRATVTRRAPHKPSPVPPPCSLGWQEVQLLQAPRWNTRTPTPNPPPPPARPLLPRGWRARAQCQREAVVDAQLVPRLSQLELLVLWSLQKPVWLEVVVKRPELCPLGVLGWRQAAKILRGRCEGWPRRAGTSEGGRRRSGSPWPRGPALPRRMTKLPSTPSQPVTPWIKIYSCNFFIIANKFYSYTYIGQTLWIKGKPYLMYLESKFDWIWQIWYILWCS